MDVVERESAMIESAADPGRAARGGAPRPSGRRFLGGFSLRPALAGLGVFLLLAAAVAGYALHDDGTSEQPEAVFTVKAEKPDSPATGRLEVNGDTGMLHVSNLPPTGGTRSTRHGSRTREAPAAPFTRPRSSWSPRTGSGMWRSRTGSPTPGWS